MATHAEPTTAAFWKKASLLALLCALSFVLYPLLARLALGEWTFPFDDPWTHQVYARNLAQTGQYAFNPGEPSTASSAPLWTALMVPAHWFGINPVLWALAWGLLSFAALGWVAWSWAERHFARPLPALLTGAILLTPHIAWSGVEGMETALVAAVALLILSRADRGPWTRGRDAFVDGLLNGVLLWLRPEAPLLTLISSWPRRRAGWKQLLLYAAGYLVLTLPYLGLNWAISGRPLPQTVYAKVAYYARPLSPASLATFLSDLFWTLAPGIWPLVILLLVLAVVRMARRREWPWGPALAWAGLTVLVAAVRLPVVLHFGRHFVPVLPALVLACGEALGGLPALGRRALLVLGGCLLLIGLVVGVSFYRPACQAILDSQVAMGRWIAAHVPAEATVATHDIGAIGYFGRHRLVDTLALITPDLTPIVGAHDTAGLWAFLREHRVQYLATLDGQYEEIQHEPGVREVVREGRMVLLYASFP